MTKMTVGGVSATKELGQEKYEYFMSFSRKFVQYDYRHTDGELFTCVKATLERCRAARDEWLEQCRAARDEWLAKDEATRMPYTATVDMQYQDSDGEPFSTWRVVDEDWHTVSRHITQERAESEAARLNGAT